ncbi:MAG: FecR family protein [Niabella sp.]
MSSRVWYLLGRKLSGEAGIDELRELEGLLLANPDLAARVKLHEKYFKYMRAANKTNKGVDAAWQQIAEKIETTSSVPETKKSFSIISLKWWVAASIIAIFALAGSLWLFNKDNPVTTTAGVQVAEMPNPVQLLTATTEKTRNVLPDGSVVWLNNNSRITYNENFGKTNREIVLEGEAFFDVAHKAELPMVVHAGVVDVKVKGTAFNIKSYASSKEIETSLIRGSIELVVHENNKERKILMEPNEKVVVDVIGGGASKPEVAASQPLIKEPLKVEQKSGLIPEIAWIQGQLVFNNESLTSLAKKMEKWYHVQIFINDSVLAAEKFTGAFKDENLEEALDALQFTYGFKYKIDQHKIYITKK